MRLIIRDDADSTSAYVANYIVNRINAYKPNAENPFVLGLPTGSSPQGVYKKLVEKYKAGEVSFLFLSLFFLSFFYLLFLAGLPACPALPNAK